MEIIKALLKEFEAEFITTKAFLLRVPVDQSTWAPHEKSMKLLDLALHIADLPQWVDLAFNTDELDFAAGDWTPKTVTTNNDLTQILEDNYKKGVAALKACDVSKFEEKWVLRTGDTIHLTINRWEMMRMSFSQTIHHRAQLGVYLRLLDIPIPGTYGPSADEQAF